MVLVSVPPDAGPLIVNASGEIVGPHGPEISAACAVAVRAADAKLAVHQRVAARPWPEADFPRTHTLKVRREAVRAWADVDVPIEIHG